MLPLAPVLTCPGSMDLFQEQLELLRGGAAALGAGQGLDSRISYS